MNLWWRLAGDYRGIRHAAEGEEAALSKTHTKKGTRAI